MSDIVLINPRTSLNIENNEPLNLLSLAAYLEAKNLTASIFDEFRPLTSLEEALRQTRYIGITSNTCSYPRAVELVQHIKRYFPHVRTIAGGVHPTTRPDDAFRDGFDIVVVGEGERALVRILSEAITEGLVHGTEVSEQELYRPARHLIDMPFYARTKDRCPHDPNLNFMSRGTRMACYLTSRGCPFQCIFCHNIWRHSKVRFVETDRVIEELTSLKTTYQVEAVWLMDDHIFLHKSRAIDLFQKMIASRLNLIWASAARVDSLSDELLELAYRAGCRRLSLGIESGSQRILDRISKGTTVEANARAIAMCKKHNIRALATIMIGNPDETLSDLRATQAFIRRTQPDDLAVSILTPFPGTLLWKQCEEKGLIPSHPVFSQFNYLKAPVQLSCFISPERLEVYKRRILTRYYLHPSRLSPFLGKVLSNPWSMFHKVSEYFL
ncbi:MAG TPA: radical SAM protein [Candidatus Ozemobacteraceae bacterium]|nr:radical SAM protein [Candidatus Ozemobacteraceae bacterium]